MTPEQITQLIDELTKRLGPAGQHVFDLAVRQVYIDAGASFVGLLAIVAACSVATLIIWRHHHECTRSYCEHVIAETLVGFAWICAILVGHFLVQVALGVLNPEYAALRGLMGAVR